MISFSKDKNMIKILEIEKKSLNAMLDIQKNLNRQILLFLKNFLGDINVDINFDSENLAFNYIKETSSILDKSNSNISKINSLTQELDDIIAKINDSSIEKKITQYNNKFNREINQIYKNTSLIEEFIHKISLLDLSEITEKINKNSETIKESSNLTIDSNILDSSFVENTLIISEMKNKVILPYTITEINNILFNDNNKYKSIEEVINEVYTKPIKKYRFPAVSRFKEAYRLVIEKEHKSKAKALSLATELFGKYNLHPAIITACKSLDELDIYLACLEDDVLDEFPFFEIRYEVAPAIQKKQEPDFL